MPPILQLQIWMCFGPIVAAMLFAPTVFGARPALINGTPAVYFCDSSTSVQVNESEASVQRVRRNNQLPLYTQFAPSQMFDEPSSVALGALAGSASSRAP